MVFYNIRSRQSKDNPGGQSGANSKEAGRGRRLRTASADAVTHIVTQGNTKIPKCKVKKKEKIIEPFELQDYIPNYAKARFAILVVLLLVICISYLCKKKIFV